MHNIVKKTNTYDCDGRGAGIGGFRCDSLVGVLEEEDDDEVVEEEEEEKEDEEDGRSVAGRGVLAFGSSSSY